MQAEAVTYNPRTHRLEWGGPNDRTFLTVTGPWWLSQEAMDKVLASLVSTAQERDGIRKRIADEVRAKGCPCLELSRYQEGEPYTFDGFIDNGKVLRHDPRCPAAIAAEIEAAGEEAGK